MNEQELKSLWDKINAKYKVKDLTYEQLKEKLSTQDLRRRFHERYGAALELGTVDEFEKRMVTQSLTQPTIFDCVKKVHTNASITSTTLVAKITNTKTYNFFSNDRFSYKDGTKLLMGSWSCDGGDNYSVKLDNGQTYSSKNKVWSEIPVKEPDKSQPPKSEPDKPQPPKSEPDKSKDQYGTNKAILLQRGKNNLKIAGSDAIIY